MMGGHPVQHGDSMDNRDVPVPNDGYGFWQRRGLSFTEVKTMNQPMVSARIWCTMSMEIGVQVQYDTEELEQLQLYGSPSRGGGTSTHPSAGPQAPSCQNCTYLGQGCSPGNGWSQPYDGSSWLSAPPEVDGTLMILVESHLLKICLPSYSRMVDLLLQTTELPILELIRH